MSAETPPGSAPADPKTELKVAKAYVKAQRPWYKKKRYIALGLIAVWIVIGVAFGGCGEAVPTDGSTCLNASREEVVRWVDAKGVPDGVIIDDVALEVYILCSNAATAGAPQSYSDQLLDLGVIMAREAYGEPET